MDMTRSRIWLGAAMALLLCCERDDLGTKPAGSAKAPRTTSPAIFKLLDAVPGDAQALAFLDLPQPLWGTVTGGILPIDAANRAILDKDLRGYVDKHLGLDLSKLQYAVGYVAGPPGRGALLVEAVGGTLKAPGGVDVDGAKLWAIDAENSLAHRDGLIVLGATAAVREVLETKAGKRKAVTSENKPLVDWLRAETRGAAVGVALLAPKGLPLPPEVEGLERAALAVGLDGLRAVVDGSDPAIGRLQTQIDAGFAMALGQVETARRAALDGSVAPAEGVGAIIGAAYAKSFADRMKPRRTGNRLTVSVDLSLADAAAPTAVAVIGVLAAVAIPAFMDYMKKSKKTEASLILNKMAKNLKVFHATNGAFPKGRVGPSPVGACCEGPRGKCDDPKAWDAPLWQEIDMRLDEPHMFQYAYTSDGAKVVIKAIGDLDCDGVPVEYVLEALVNPDGSVSATIIEPPPNAD